MKNIDTNSIKFWNYIYPFLSNTINEVDNIGTLINNVPFNMSGTNSLYVHIPFCETICAFCPFLKTIYDSKTVDQYLDCLEKEVLLLKEFPLNKQMILDTVTIGGGSPTALNKGQLSRLLNMIVSHFEISKDCEWSVECEAKSFTEEKAIVMKEYGVNRISIGMQTLNEKYRKMLNLTATIVEVEDAIHLAKKYFHLQNLDLLYGLPGQTKDEILDDIEKAMALGSTSIDTYPLEYVSCSASFLRKIESGKLPKRPSLDDVISLTKSIFNYFHEKNWDQVLTYTFFSPSLETSKRRFKYGEALYGKISDYILGIGASSLTHFEGLCYVNSTNIKDYMSMLENENLPIIKARKYFAYERELISFPKRIVIEKKYIEKISMIYTNVKEVFDDWIKSGYLEDTGDFFKLKTEYRAYFIPMMYQLLPLEEREYMVKLMESVESKKLGIK